MTRCLFYSDFRADPYYNMAVDEWMLARAIRATDDTVLLRLYSWMPGAITFGMNQRLERAMALDRVGETPIVRRVTGGRALYHDPSEVTYSIALNSEHQRDGILGGSLSESSSAIAGALVGFLERLGIQSQYMRQSSEANADPTFFHSAPCFASHARWEVVGSVGKLIASAQRRLSGALLQHGAIKIGGLASHPALALDGVSGGDLEAVSEERFNSVASVFRAALGIELGLDVDATSYDEGALEQIESRVDHVKKNFADVREILNR